jgi:putative Ca2+/H+ antiporter (TMEM165/GDT1 family)
MSFGAIFLAELGDRSQLIAMTYALRYRWWVVLAGVGVAACLAHGAWVAIGHSLGWALPAQPMALCASVAFLVFAIWTWRERANDGPEVGPVREPRFALPTIISSFLLAELGDKTTLATVALASRNDWVGVWIGTTLGMVGADALAIAAGVLLHRRLPRGMLHVLASLLLLMFGLWMLFDGALGWHRIAVGVTGCTALAAAALAAVRFMRSPGPPAEPTAPRAYRGTG